MFMGEFDHTTDPKGRLIVPSKFREGLGDTFVITKGLDGCLLAYDKQEWQIVTEGLHNLSLVDKAGRQFTRFFFAGAAEIEMDKQGRILVPTDLRDYAGLEKDVVLIGMADKIEIWSKERWEDVSADQDVADTLELMADWGIRI